MKNWSNAERRQAEQLARELAEAALAVQGALIVADGNRDRARGLIAYLYGRAAQNGTSHKRLVSGNPSLWRAYAAGLATAFGL